MRYRPFGKTGLTTSEVGFGCARIGGVFQGSSRSETIALLRRALDAGITLFDTADMYTQGESERLVGQAFAHQRDRVLIATKFGYCLPAQKQLIDRIKPFVKPLVALTGLTSNRVHARLRGAVSQQDFSAAYLRSAVEASLKRLRTDYIDILQLHDPSVEVLERGECIETLERLQVQGKIRHWGVACRDEHDALVSLQHPSLGSIQVGYSALEQTALDAAIPQSAARGVGIIARQVYASGLLTRPVERVFLEQIDSEPTVARRKHAQLAAFESIVDRSGRSRTEMALQFALARQDISVVLLGISRAEQLESNLRALDAPALSAEEHAQLTAARQVASY